ncbi:8078_t:CDS:2 [Cetraspora pellucida]|uniref:8078_t:CDS:1 n=1 Tax=Cetraspora pellucida TaxID=1433469 RepID=A0A9N8ZZ29_9GLOM|nr:8078_t:CDS:2 [Cetraspora pellucida]
MRIKFILQLLYLDIVNVSFVKIELMLILSNLDILDIFLK